MKFILPTLLVLCVGGYVYFVTSVFDRKTAKTEIHPAPATIDTSLIEVKSKTIPEGYYSFRDSSMLYIETWAEYQNERGLELQYQILYNETGKSKYGKEFYYHQKRRIALAKKAERINKWLKFKKPE